MAKYIKVIEFRDITPPDLDGLKYKLKFEIGNVKNNIFSAEDSKQIEITLSRTLQTIWGLDDDQINFVVGSIAFANVLELAKKDELHLLKPIVLNTFTSGKEPPTDLYPITAGSIFSFAKISKKESQIDRIKQSFLYENISEIRDHINTYTKYFLGKRIFLIYQERALFDIYESTNSDKEFIHRLSSLTGLILAIDKKTIKNKLEKDSDDKTGVITLLEELLTIYSDKNTAKEICIVLKNINELRKGYPIHGDNIESIIPAHDYFNLTYPIDNYDLAWESILIKYFRAMNRIKEIFIKYHSDNKPS